MTTNLDIIKRAMKKLHVLGSGGNPTSAEAFDGLDALRALYVELIGQGSLGRMNDVLATSDYEAREFDRVHYATGITVTLPTSITVNSCTYDYGFAGGYQDWVIPNNGGSARPPLDRCPIILINTTDNTKQYHVWRTSTHEWVRIDGLGLQDDFPFADYLEDGFAALLAERLTDEWDQPLGAQTQRQANACRLLLSTKPDSPMRNTASRANYM